MSGASVSTRLPIAHFPQRRPPSAGPHHLRVRPLQEREADREGLVPQSPRTQQRREDLWTQPQVLPTHGHHLIYIYIFTLRYIHYSLYLQRTESTVRVYRNLITRYSPIVLYNTRSLIAINTSLRCFPCSFVFLQLYHSPFFGNEANKPLLLPKTQVSRFTQPPSWKMCVYCGCCCCCCCCLLRIHLYHVSSQCSNHSLLVFAR